MIYNDTYKALGADEPIDGLTHEQPNTPRITAIYGFKYFVCETIMRTTAKTIADNLGIELKEIHPWRP
jgi:hypothetical protein